MTTCDLCQREVSETTEHHLIPKSRHKNKKNKRDFSREEVKERKANLCGPCHKTIHQTFSEKELERQFSTLKAIKSHPRIRRFVRWISKRDLERIK